MADYYIDPTQTGGTNNGGGAGTANDPTDANNWTNAWTSLQAAVDDTSPQITAGDIIYMKASGSTDETISATIDIDNTSILGTVANRIKFVGVNSSGVNDGTRYKIVGDGTPTTIILISASCDYLTFENIEVSAASTAAGWDAASGNIGVSFINCAAHTNGGYGFDGQYLGSSFFYRCVAYNNGNTGFYYIGTGSGLMCCCAHDNGSSGITTFVGNTIIGCISYKNTLTGISGGQLGGYIINNTVDQNGSHGLEMYADGAVIVGNRVTDNVAQGIDGSLEFAYYGGNYINGNGTAAFQDQGTAPFGFEQLFADVTTGTDGYTDPASGDDDAAVDYNLTASATSRRVAITIPVT